MRDSEEARAEPEEDSGEAQVEKPKVTVDIGGEAKLKPTLKLTPPKGGWNPSLHQKPRKPIGKTK